MENVIEEVLECTLNIGVMRSYPLSSLRKEFQTVGIIKTYKTEHCFNEEPGETGGWNKSGCLVSG